MPHRVRIGTGSLIGLLGYRIANQRRHIIDVNLRLCFPDMGQPERDQLIRRTFRSTGISLIETALVWLRDPADFRHLVTISGLENLQRAQEEGKGVILLGMHLATLDFCGAVLSTYIGFDVMYRRNKNELLEMIMTRGRIKNYPKAIQRNDVRAVVKRLKQGEIVWYGPDQDYGRKHSVFAPFFATEAASITALARIARMTGSPLVPFSHHRRADGPGYEIILGEPLENYPVDDEVENAKRINQIVENAIERSPEQYWWLHRRFKTQPPGKNRPY
jgi:KDO2-lipid IV(A) lauroyltransferase|tara:strand:+ start:28262 stop:29086 length:825 start_codon:yes stop_codon:yes gene_type:complete